MTKSSHETQSLWANLEHLEDAKKVVDRMIVQLGHLRVHINVDDPVVGYWYNHLFRQLSGLSIDLEEAIRSWHEDG